MKKSEEEVLKGGEAPSRATPIAYSDVERLIVDVRGQPVIVDADVAKLYGVATKTRERGRSQQSREIPCGLHVRIDGGRVV